MRKLAAVPASKPSLYRPGISAYAMAMTVDEFITVPRCPFQRNEGLRLNKSHLRVLRGWHSIVTVIVMPDGTICKGDGHTRAAKWADGSLARPTELLVNVVLAKDLAEVEEIYDALDAVEAAKNGNDRIQSGLSRSNVKLATSWLASGQFSSSLLLASGVIGKASLSKKQQVDLFGPELTLFDIIVPHKERFIIGIAAGALLLLKKYGASGLDFLGRYNSDLGIKNGSERDAVQMLTELVKGDKASRLCAGDANNKRHAATMLALHARHVGGKMHKRLPSPLDLASYHRV